MPSRLEILIVLLGVCLLVLLLKKMFKHPHGLTIALILGICGLALMAVAYRIPSESLPSPPAYSERDQAFIWPPEEASKTPVIVPPVSVKPIPPIDLNLNLKSPPSSSRLLVEQEPAAAIALPTEESKAASAKRSSTTGVLRALGNALAKMAGDNPRTETAAEFVTRALPATAAGPPRPAWVDAPAKTVDGVYQMAVAIGPYESRLECDRNLPENVRQAVDQYVGELLGPKAVGRIGVPNDYLRTHLVKEQWEEQKEITVTSREKVPMTLLHVLVTFDNDAKRFLSDAWHQVLVQERLRHVALWGGYVLLVLTTFWGYLKLDLATNGLYRKRLRLATALAVAVLAVLASTWA